MDDQLRRQQDSLHLQTMAQEIIKSLADTKGLEQLANQVKMEIVREGLRIELLDKSESFFFDVGTATMKPEAQKVLNIIAHELGKLPNHVILEGHTVARRRVHQLRTERRPREQRAPVACDTWGGQQTGR